MIAIRIDVMRDRVSWCDGHAAEAYTIDEFIKDVARFRKKPLVFFSAEEAAMAVTCLRRKKAWNIDKVSQEDYQLLARGPFYVITNFGRTTTHAWWYERAAHGKDRGTYDEEDTDLRRWREDAIILAKTAITPANIFGKRIRPIEARYQLQTKTGDYGRFMTLAQLARRRFAMAGGVTRYHNDIRPLDGLDPEAVSFVRLMRNNIDRTVTRTLFKGGIGVSIKMSKAALRVEPMTHRLLKGRFLFIDVKSFYPSLLRHMGEHVGGAYYELLDKKLRGEASFVDKLLLNSFIGTLNMGRRPKYETLFYNVTVNAQAVMLTLLKAILDDGAGIPVYGINDSLLIYEPTAQAEALIRQVLGRYGLTFSAWRPTAFAFDGINQVFITDGTRHYGTGKFNFSDRTYLSPLHFREGARLALAYAGIEVPPREIYHWGMITTDGTIGDQRVHKVVLVQRCENATYVESLKDYVSFDTLDPCVSKITNTKFRMVKAIS